MSDMLDYYARRAAEYDRVYDKPERQDELGRLGESLTDWLADRDVLEIACGTGYWTAVAARRARSILATDAVAEVLALAENRCRGLTHVTFKQANAFDLGQPAFLSCDGGLAAFLVSHVEKQKLAELLRRFHAALLPGSRVALCDSRYVAGSNTAVSRTDETGNTYQLRTLADGSRHEILKNFLSADEIRSALAAAGSAHVEITELTYFWCARYGV